MLLISPGNINDMSMAQALIDAAAGRFNRLIADRGYDSNAIRAAIAAHDAEVVIPSTTSRRAPIPYDAPPIAPATSSNASGVGSRTGAASPPAMTSSPPITSPAHSSPPASSTGAIESGA